jgi:uncharacterized protein involved in exopolysaccharide biosynthesis
MVLVGLVLGFLYSVVVLFLTPKKYESSTIVEFRKSPEAFAKEEWSVANEVALITSSEFLVQVAEDLDLARKWGMDLGAVTMMLSGVIDVEAVKESDFQKITVTHVEAREARDIANEIPKTFSRFKAIQRGKELDFKLRSLGDKILERQDLADESEATLQRLLKNVGLTQSVGDRLESTTLADYFQNHPEKENAVALEEYRLAWREYASRQDILKALEEERNKTIVLKAESYVPLKVHGEAKVPLVASYPVFEAGLWWGLLKGLIFGLVLGALTLLFYRLKRGDGDEPAKPRKREGEPGDVWE